MNIRKNTLLFVFVMFSALRRQCERHAACARRVLKEPTEKHAKKAKVQKTQQGNKSKNKVKTQRHKQKVKKHPLKNTTTLATKDIKADQQVGVKTQQKKQTNSKTK